MKRPELSVVVASHNRPLRLRWLLNALEQQTLERSLWEVVVCHDSGGTDTDALLATHPLAADGTLRSARHDPSSAGAKRNAATALAAGEAIVFTDDDCRPPEDWLANVRAAVRRHPGAVIQGPVHGDPDEAVMRRASFARTQLIEEIPGRWAECCNIAYPRALVQWIGGFADNVSSGEDTDLNIRARAAGALYVGDQQMLTYHAIEDGTARGWIDASWRWTDVPWLVGRHPQVRGWLTWKLFWKRAHVLLPLAVFGAARARRHPAWLLLAIPWVAQPRSGRRGVRGRIRDVLDLPGWAAIDLVETSVMVRGSIRHRTLVL